MRIVYYYWCSRQLLLQPMLQRRRQQQQQLLLLLLILPLVVLLLVILVVVVVVSCCCYCCSCNTSTTTSPSRLKVARQSYILEVSHIHLCDWRRSLLPCLSPVPSHLSLSLLSSSSHLVSTRPFSITAVIWPWLLNVDIFYLKNENEWMNKWKCNDFKCVRKRT